MATENAGEGALKRNPRDRRRSSLATWGRRPTAQKLGLHLVDDVGRNIRTMSAAAETPEIISAKNAEWEKGNELAKKWNEPGSVQALADKNPEAAKQSTSGKCDTVACMDGRTDKEGKVACAGCGLALLKGNSVNLRQLDVSNPEDTMKFLKTSHPPVANFIEGLKKAGIKHTESHPGCGAGTLYSDFYKDKWGGEMSGDEAARLWAEKLAKLLGGNYKGHIEVQPAYHNERAAYYSFSDSFNPKSAPGVFLPGYVISRGRFADNPNHAAEEMALAATISFGKDGFGDRFTDRNPFFFVIVARNANEAAAGKRELEPRLARFGGKVKLQTVIIA